MRGQKILYRKEKTMQTRTILTHKIYGATKSFLARAIYRATRKEREIHKNAVTSVLKRAAIDETFRTALLFSGTNVLEGYELTGQEKAALISGDIRWIEKNMSPLTPDKKDWLLHRLEAEVW